MKDKSDYTPKNHREWFLHYLFEDDEFIQEKDVILDNLKEIMSDDEYGLMFLLSRKQPITQQLRERSIQKKSHIQALLLRNKPELLFDEAGAEAVIVQKIEDLAKRFNVSIATVEQGLRYRRDFAAFTLRTTPVVHIDDGDVVIRLSADMRFADLRAVYSYVQQLQSELPNYRPRNRSKVRPDLIYSIYKQRLHGRTFKEIYTLYEKRELPGYEGSSSLVGEDALARMYRRFKPDS